MKKLYEETFDSKFYAKFSKECPEGHIILDQKEKADFEKWLRI